MTAGTEVTGACHLVPELVRGMAKIGIVARRHCRRLHLLGHGRVMTAKTEVVGECDRLEAVGSVRDHRWCIRERSLLSLRLSRREPVKGHRRLLRSFEETAAPEAELRVRDPLRTC
jgi:hypothetical protein